jgi:hypothetical protein
MRRRDSEGPRRPPPTLKTEGPSSRNERWAAFNALHERIVVGDGAAREELAARMLPWLRGRCRAGFRHAGDEIVNDAAEDAILQYLAHPERFDPSKGVPLDRFLHVVAWRRLANQVRNAAAKGRRDAAHAALVMPNEVGQVSGYTSDRDETVTMSRILAAVTDPRERGALLGWIAGDADVVLAKALGTDGLPAGEQSREVKRFKDRIRRRLRRQLR